MGLFDAVPLCITGLFRPIMGVWGKAQVISRTPSAQRYWESDDERGMGYGNFVEISKVSEGDYVFSQSGTYTKVLKVLKKHVPFNRWNALFVDDPFPLEGVFDYNDAERKCFKRKGFFLGYATETQEILGGLVASLLLDAKRSVPPFLLPVVTRKVIREFRGSPYAGRVSDVPKSSYKLPQDGIVFYYYDTDTVKMWAKQDLVKKVNSIGVDKVLEEARQGRSAPNYVQMITIKPIECDYAMMGDETAYNLVTENGTFVADGLYLRSEGS